MDYRKIVAIIKDATKIDVPVYFEDNEANCGGSAYFGLGEHTWDIIPEDCFDNPMFEVDDFIENRHISYYHVGLPTVIEPKRHDFIYQITQQQVDDYGIPLLVDHQVLEVFIMLHEFGHAKQLLLDYQGDIHSYMKDTQEVSRSMSYFIRSEGYAGTEKGLLLHKSLSTEQYADNFALSCLDEVIREAKSQDLLQ